MTTDSKSPLAGWYWSDSLMLVSNKVDDEYSDAQVGADEAAPGANLPIKGGYAHPLQDRTHRIALGGNVEIKYTPADNTVAELSTTASVPIVNTVKLHANILEDANGKEVIAKNVVEGDIHRANEQYAQLGIRFSATVQQIAQPAGVNLANGLGSPITFDKATLTFSQEAQSLMAAATRTAALDDIEI